MELDPNSVKAYNNKANILRKMKQFKEAIQAVDNCLKIDPNYLNALDTKGEIYLDDDRIDDAIEFFDKALKIDPTYEPSSRKLRIAQEKKRMSIQ